MKTRERKEPRGEKQGREMERGREKERMKRRAGTTRRMVIVRTRTRTRTRRAAVERALTCCLNLFTTSSGASTWPWNRHLRSVSKTSSITEMDRSTVRLDRYE